MTIPRVHLPHGGAASSCVAILCCLGFVFAGALRAQTAASTAEKEPAPSSTLSQSAPNNPTFDVASIHPNHYDRTNHSHLYTEANQGRFRAINASVMQVIGFAYEMPEFRILNAPGWLRSEKFDIEARSNPALAARLATIPYASAKPELAAMVRSLLAERFHLAAHIEKRRLPVYFLVIAKGGPKLRSGQDAPKHLDTGNRDGAVALTINNSSHATADLCEMLYRYAGRIIVDKTGLTGNYSLALHFSQDDARAAIPTRVASTAQQDSGPSVFTAVKEQLGLELKTGKAPVDVLVIERVEAPTEN